MTVNEKISLLREKMKQHGFDAYIIPTADPHLSEYVPEHYQFRRWVSGFTGSAATVAVTAKESGLWTDGRYYIQAEKELNGSEIRLFRAFEPGVKSYVQFLCDELKRGDTVGLCGKLFSRSNVEAMEKKFAEKGIKIDTETDISQEIWLADRPKLPYEKAFVLDEKYSGEAVSSKIHRLREEMKNKKVTCYATDKLDCVMWLYNIRGNDIPCCPFALGYALVGEDFAKLYMDEKSLTQEVREYLANQGVTISPYEDIYRDIALLDEAQTLGADFAMTNNTVVSQAKNCSVKNIRDIVTAFKAVKNETEIQNLYRCYENDVAALTKGMYYIFDSLDKNKRITECDVDEKLKELRALQPLNIGTSFDTIAAYKANAAMMHYKPEEDSCAVLKKEGMLLIDSGGQYLNGTTDITRTLVLGEISHEEKRNFTLVLKANIALMNAKFLKGTTGANLDILARGPLWNEGIDYKCGTGHGVGFCLNVHEGPQNFSQSLRSVPFEIGMNCTVEPGVYIEGKYGIRTENDVVTVPFMKTEHGEFYGFDILSYCPIDVNGIDASLLTAEEKAWLNSYHKRCRELLKDKLTKEEYAWLKAYTRDVE